MSFAQANAATTAIKLTGIPAHPPWLIYAGKEGYERSGVQVIGWWALAALGSDCKSPFNVVLAKAGTQRVFDLSRILKTWVPAFARTTDFFRASLGEQFRGNDAR